LPLTSTIMLPAGRRQRFFGTLGVALVAVALLIPVLVAVAASSLLLNALLFGFFGRVNGVAVFHPVAFVPLVLAFRLLYRNRVAFVVVVLAALSLLYAPLIAILTIAAPDPGPWISADARATIISISFDLIGFINGVIFQPKLLSLSVLAVVGWSSVVLLTHRICTRQNLVRTRAGARV
jgi:hypothetical protein